MLQNIVISIERQIKQVFSVVCEKQYVIQRDAVTVGDCFILTVLLQRMHIDRDWFSSLQWMQPR